MSLATLKSKIERLITECTGTGSRQWWLDVCANKISFQFMFNGCSNLTTVPQLDTSKGTSFQSMFSNCSNLTTVPQLDTSKGTNFQFMFNGCSNLTTVPQFDTSKGTALQYMFNGCYNLTTVSFVKLSINYSISFLHSPLLSDESIQSIIDGLAIVTGQTVTFHPTVFAKLTDEQKLTILEKGWIIK